MRVDRYTYNAENTNLGIGKHAHGAFRGSGHLTVEIGMFHDESGEVPRIIEGINALLSGDDGQSAKDAERAAFLQAAQIVQSMSRVAFEGKEPPWYPIINRIVIELRRRSEAT